MALAAAAQEVLFLRQLLSDFGFTQSHPTLMFEDNKSCISLATNNPMTTAKTKHIDIRYHFVRDLATTKQINIQWTDTTDMIADILTKFSLPTSLHLKHASRMLTGTYSGPPRPV